MHRLLLQRTAGTITFKRNLLFLTTKKVSSIGIINIVKTHEFQMKILQAESEKKIIQAESEQKILQAESEKKIIQAESEKKILQAESEKQIIQAESEKKISDLRLEHVSDHLNHLNNFIEQWISWTSPTTKRAPD